MVARQDIGGALTDVPSVNAYKLDGHGLARLFGELEASVMEAVWALGQATVTDASRYLSASQQYTTIQTVLNRLADKGILDRSSRQANAVVYRPVEPRHVFLERTSRLLVASLLTEFGPAAMRGLVDAVGELESAQLSALEEAVREVRRGKA
jgi:predicted transcriptional regulator